MCMGFSPAYMLVYHVHAGHFRPSGTEFKELLATKWVLGTAPRFSGRAAGTLNNWAISPAANPEFQYCLLHRITQPCC